MRPAVNIFLTLLFLGGAAVSAAWVLSYGLTRERRHRQLRRSLIFWSVKGLVAPLAIWALMNLGLSWNLQPFMPQVQALFKPDDIILATCRSGGRGAMAVNMLAAAGYKNVYNITDGIEGDEVKDPESQYYKKRMKNGWKNSGLPWTYDINPDLMKLPKN